MLRGGGSCVCGEQGGMLQTSGELLTWSYVLAQVIGLDSPGPREALKTWG